MTCDRTKMFCKVGCRFAINLGEVNFRLLYSCSITCFSRLYWGGGISLYRGGGFGVCCFGCLSSKYFCLSLNCTVAIAFSMTGIGYCRQRNLFLNMCTVAM